MFKQKLSTLLCVALLGGVLIHCSSSETAADADNTDTAVLTENASAAVTALFGGSDASASESVVQNFLIGYAFQTALAEAGVAGSNCEEVDSGDPDANITFTNAGTNGTFGPEGDSVTIDGTTEAFCSDDGQWSTYEFTDDQSVEFTCSDESSFFMTGGSGIWRESTDGTEIAGEFEISTDSAGTGGVTVNCHGTIGHDSDDAFTLNCFDADGVAVTSTSDISCESEGDGDGQGSGNNDGGSCTTDEDCDQTDLPEGIGFVECRDFGGEDGTACMYSCTEDSQCQELSGSEAFCSVDNLECER